MSILQVLSQVAYFFSAQAITGKYRENPIKMCYFGSCGLENHKIAKLFHRLRFEKISSSSAKNSRYAIKQCRIIWIAIITSLRLESIWQTSWSTRFLFWYQQWLHRSFFLKHFLTSFFSVRNSHEAQVYWLLNLHESW